MLLGSNMVSQHLGLLLHTIDSITTHVCICVHENQEKIFRGSCHLKL